VRAVSKSFSSANPGATRPPAALPDVFTINFGPEARPCLPGDPIFPRPCAARRGEEMRRLRQRDSGACGIGLLTDYRPPTENVVGRVKLSTEQSAKARCTDADR
jgi:hypothetical protein